jgi:hypothetical protein
VRSRLREFAWAMSEALFVNDARLKEAKGEAQPDGRKARAQRARCVCFVHFFCVGLQRQTRELATRLTPGPLPRVPASLLRPGRPEPHHGRDAGARDGGLPRHPGSGAILVVCG